MPALDSILFDTGLLTPRDVAGNPNVSAWITPEGDGVSTNSFPLAPSLPAARSVSELAQFYASQLAPASGKVFECAVVSLAGIPSIRLIVKLPQRPHGMTYLGNFTLPFRDFSYVLKVQCLEQGTTGVREAILLDKALKSGAKLAPGPNGPIPGWNPDALEHDATFPAHPVSRVRRLLGHIASTTVIESDVAKSTRFPLPT